MRGKHFLLVDGYARAKSFLETRFTYRTGRAANDL
jgi:hypothetical protein